MDGKRADLEDGPSLSFVLQLVLSANLTQYPITVTWFNLNCYCFKRQMAIDLLAST